MRESSSGQGGTLSQDVEITRAMILRVVDSLRKSGALADSALGVAALAEQILLDDFLPPGRENTKPAISRTPSKTASSIDRYL